MEVTLAMIKPDGVARKIVGNVIKAIEVNDMTIVAIKMVHMNDFQASNFYGMHKDKPFYEDLVKFTTSGPVVVMVLAGDDVVNKWRELMGATNSAEAEESTIRGTFGSKEVIRENVVHGSDSTQSGIFESMFFFNRFEF